MAIIYRATLTDDSEIMKITNITVLSESMARGSFTFDSGEIPIIYNNIAKSFTVTFVDPHRLVDTLSIDQSLSVNEFDKAEITCDEDVINLILKTSDFTFEHTDFIHLNVKYGDHRIQYPIQLNMKL